MIKVSTLFCLICLAVAAPALRAQNATDVNIASEEAIRRQADTITLRRTLVEAQGARQRGDILEAHKLYERCYDLVTRIGTGGIEPEARATVAGLSEVLFAMGRAYQDKHDYLAAGEQFNRILVIDPKNQAAAKEKFENDKLYHAQLGSVPSPEQIKRIPTFQTNEIRIATMVQDGKLLYEAGHLDEAEDKFQQAYNEDPSNVAAFQYLQMVKQRRIADAERKTELSSDDSLLHVQKAWTRDRSNGELVPHPNLFARTNVPYTAKGRQTIVSKLDRIKLDSVKYDDLPLTEVINNLNESAKQRDPDKQGINFFIDRSAPATAAAGGAIDPATGLPVAAPLPTDAGDISAVTVKITPGLADVRLADVLDAITKTASKPIRYSVLDYAVVFALRGAEPVPLELRTFHVDPNTFRMGLESVSGLEFGNVSGSSSGGSGGGGGGGGSSGSSGNTTGAIVPYVLVPSGGIQSSGGGSGGGGGGGGGSIGGGGGQGGQGGGGLTYVTGTSNTTALLQVMVRNFFAAVGVDLNTNNPANVGKMFVWNDRKGVLMVRSTAQDLDMIENAIQVLNQAPPEVNIKAKFIEITQNDSKALGFNWFLGNTRIGGSTVASGGTQPSLNGTPTTSNPEGTFPGSSLFGTTQLPTSSDGNITPQTALRDTAPTIATFTGILTDPQFRVAIQALEQRDGVDELNAPEVTTESGRQAQIQAIDIQTIVTGVNVNTSSGAGVSGVANGVNSPIVQQVPTINFPTSPLPFGPTLDVIPYVSADEFSVQMTLIPTITEFIGYDDPGQFVPAALVAGQTGNASLQAVLPLPHFRARQVTTSVSVWDAQTVVLGGLMVDTVTKIKDKVPMLGDLPLVGRLFQSQSSNKTKKNLMIFVTPTIINPDGTRYHSDDEMPFLQNATPVAKPLASQ